MPSSLDINSSICSGVNIGDNRAISAVAGEDTCRAAALTSGSKIDGPHSSAVSVSSSPPDARTETATPVLGDSNEKPVEEVVAPTLTSMASIEASEEEEVEPYCPIVDDTSSMGTMFGHGRNSVGTVSNPALVGECP